MSPIRRHHPRATSAPLVLQVSAVVVALAMALGGCSTLGANDPNPSSSQGHQGRPPHGEPEANPIVSTLAKGLATGRLDGVSFVGDPAQAQKKASDDLGVIMAGMDGLTPAVKPRPVVYKGDGIATVELDQSYGFGTKPWTFTSTASLNLVGGEWRVVWNPEIVHPQLTAKTRLRHTRDLPSRAPIVDKDGKSVMWSQSIFDVGLDKANVPSKDWPTSAKDLAQALDIDAAVYQKKVANSGPKAFVLATSVRKNQLPGKVRAIPGALTVTKDATLALRPGFADSLLGVVGSADEKTVKESKGIIELGEPIGRTGLQRRYDEQLRGTVGHTITQVLRRGATDANHVDATLYSLKSVEGKAVQLGLSIGHQTRAENALKGVKPVASLVAVDLRTGQVLAAANSAASDANPDATFGRYAPGSTFKLATALAMVRQGMSAQTKVSCPATATVKGRVFKNYDDYPRNKIGSISLAEAIAHSCNTVFINQAAKLPKGALAEAAASLGFGIDHEAGFPVFYGSVPTTTDPVVAAVNTIGQGQVEGSPLAVAALAASIGAGKTTLPWLVEGHTPTAKAEPLTSNEVTQLRAMMQQTVSQGSGRSLSGLVTGAKTGTAEFGTANPPKTRAWMVVYTKDMAISVLVAEGASGSRDAAPIVKKFLS